MNESIGRCGVNECKMNKIVLINQFYSEPKFSTDVTDILLALTRDIVLTLKSKINVSKHAE